MEKQFSGSTKFLDEIVDEALNEGKKIITDAEIIAANKSKKIEDEIVEIKNQYEKKLDENKKIIEKKIQSAISTEEKKQEFAARELVIKKSIEVGLKKLADFSRTKDYEKVIENLVVEAVKGLEKEDLILSVSAVEKPFITDTFLKRVEDRIQKEMGIKITISLDDKLLLKLGVMVSDKTKRLVYDNRFETRLVRYQSLIRKSVYVNIFGE